MFKVGKIVNTHGIKGEVKVKRITDFEERFAAGETVYILKEDGQTFPLTIDTHRTHKQFDLLQFKGLYNINDVEQFKGLYLNVKADQLNELGKNEYYYHEIIGCQVMTTSGDRLGEIDSILSPGANDVWVVKGEDGKEMLIPYIEDVVKHVDVDNKKVTIELMEGLLE
ncbi:ribosome maturation factor RimM [Virgibacillus sp. W0181]|uniref:ribosome maturation factor RimM n=1 Tax=Virgibacillus sp. W0181 TaxID=3391581 RepID=UPI003F46B83B